MEKKIVLFSPISGADPIMGGHDGPMLHICRKYQPDKVYLYFTAEMLEQQGKVDSVIYCIEELAKLIDHKMECIPYKQEKLREVQVFDTFIKVFSKKLNDIYQKDHPDEFYVNVSSGTPAMQSSLLLLSILSEENRYIPIQVTTPKKAQNREPRRIIPQELWESNDDNKSDNRDDCKKVDSKNWIFSLRKNLVKGLIDSYNYEAAESIVRAKNSNFSDEYRQLISGANYRSNFNLQRMDQEWEKYRKIQDFQINWEEQENSIDNKCGRTADALRNTFEYALGVLLRQERKDYVDFVRAITPLAMDIYLMFFKYLRGYDLYESSYVEKEEKGPNINKQYSWKEPIAKNSDVYEEFKKLKSYVGNDIYSGKGVTNYDVYSIVMGSLKENQEKETIIQRRIKEKLKIIRSSERMRNLAAHEMVSLNENKIRQLTEGYNSENIVNSFKFLLNYLYLGEDNCEVWQAYDKMNMMLKKKLDDENEDVPLGVIENEEMKKRRESDELVWIEDEIKRLEEEEKAETRRLAAEEERKILIEEKEAAQASAVEAITRAEAAEKALAEAENDRIVAEEERKSLIEEKETAQALAEEAIARVEKVEEVAIDAIARADAAENALEEAKVALETAEIQTSTPDSKRKLRPVHSVVDNTRNIAAGTFRLSFGVAYVSTLIAKDVKNKVFNKL